DDDSVTLSFLSIDNVGAKETDGTMVFTITLDGEAQNAFSIDYESVDGTATVEDSDYISVNGTLLFVPGDNEKTITVTIVDDSKAEADEIIVINLINLQNNGQNIIIESASGTGTIFNDDHNPVIGDISISGNEDTDINFAQTDFTSVFTDEDGDILDTLRVMSLPENGILYLNNTAITLNQELSSSDLNSMKFSPDANWFGETDFVYNAFDGTNWAEDSAIVHISILSVNDVPVAEDDSFTIPEDSYVEGNVIANDKDIDGDDLQVTQIVVNGQSYSAGTDIELDGVGILRIESNGNIVFTTEPDFNGRVPTITYKINDGNGGTDTAVITISVTEENDNPVAVDDIFTILEDSSVNGNILSNDYDVEGDEIQVTGVSVGGSSYSTGEDITIDGVGTVRIDSNGDIIFTPVANFNGEVPAITYEISDGNGGTDTAVISITTTEENDNPVAVGDIFTISEDSSVNGNILSNDYDVEGDEIQVTGVSVGGSSYSTGEDITIDGVGTVRIDSTGNIIFTPVANFNGEVPAITYEISDGKGGSDTAVINIIATEENDKPVAVDDSFTISEDSSLNGNILSNDYDPDDDELEITQITVGGNSYSTGEDITIDGVGTVKIDSNGDIIFTPVANFNGEVPAITYEISDGNGGTDSAVIIIITIEGNDAPEINDEEYSICSSSTLEGNILTNDSDPDGDALLANAVIAEAGHGTFTINGNGDFTYTSEEGFKGTEVIVVEICDSYAEPICVADTIVIIVSQSSTVVVDSEISACYGEEVLISDVSVSDYSSVSWTTSGSGEILGENSITPTYIPAENEEGAIEMVITVFGTGTCSSETVTATVTIDYAPEIIADAGNSDTITYNSQANLIADVLPTDRDYSYSWSPAELVDNPSGSTTYTVALQENTMFTVTVTDNESGCQATDSIFIVVKETIDDNMLSIKNGISPNFDGNNDVWYIEGIENFPDNRVAIFNRWGDKIIEFRNYDNTTVYWDGKNSKGKNVPDGTYYYILEIRNVKTYTGWIQVRGSR
ncbi:MAG: Ig-like domain-containing protein, partial [Draconibacterium sp.]